MTHIDKAKSLFEQKFHCSQAVFAAFASELGISEEQALKIGACFGAGMCKGEVCGACTGALMALGWVRFWLCYFNQIFCTYKDIFLKEILEECPFCYGQLLNELEEKNMNNTALSAEKTKKENIIFINDAHEKFYGLKGKKGSYDAYLIPEGIEDYSYTKDGKEVKGSQYKFKIEFPKKKK